MKLLICCFVEIVSYVRQIVTLHFHTGILFFLSICAGH
jgi:hypothetical protein